MPSHSIQGAIHPNSTSTSNANPIPLVTPTALTLSAQPPASIDHTALHFLTIEMKHTLAHSTKYARKKRDKALQNLSLVGLDLNENSTIPKGKGKEEKDMEELNERMEAIGMHVGANIADR